MELIVQSTNLFGNKYEKYSFNKLVTTVQIVSLQEKVDNVQYVLLINNNGKVIYEAYDYINFGLENFSYKKRELAINALKLFFSFIELFNIVDYKNLNRNDLPKLIRFLEGGQSNGTLIELDLNTSRSSKTINMYISIYREFFKFLNVENNVFNEKSINKIYKENNTFLAHAGSIKLSKYESSVKEIKEKRIPKYIKLHEYDNIINLIDSSNSNFQLRNKIIIKLMYESGLRISEVLGLTIEDLCFDINNSLEYIEDIENMEDKENYGIIFLRNRVSDKQYHHCKNLHIPKTTYEYSTTRYHTKNYGYNYVIVRIDTLNLIQEYIDFTNNPFNMNDLQFNRLSKCRADSVNRASNTDNYYIFISRNYTPLTISGWNKILRKIFKTVGISTDVDIKINNLNHRFRHGYAMLLKHLGFTQIEIMKKLRQKKLSSTEIYFNPDLEDDIAMAKLASTRAREFLHLNI